MKNIFNTIQLKKPKKNAFDLTHDVKLSANMGQLIPIMITEAVPGDKFTIGGDCLVKFAPMVAPIMHRVDVSLHYFFVPNRILWDNWEKWIVNQKTDGGGLYQHPYIEISKDPGSYLPLMDYLGIPDPAQTSGAVSENVNAFPFAAYQCVFNEYYRDQNLILPIDWKLQDGDNTNNTALTEIRNRAWEHDYFTSCLPWAQKGDAVLIPANFDDVQVLRNNTAGAPSNTLQAVAGSTNQVITNQGTTGPNITANELFAETSSMSMNTDINELRRAMRLQEWLEKNARGGTRYIENILSHFGVKSSDARLQRPEYITGVKSPVVISEVLNTTGTAGELPQGNMAGHGVSVSTGKYGSHFCEEHGYIIGIMSVMPRTAYQQGLAKHWLKINDPFQYFWPSFAHIGEQQVENKEVYAFDNNGTDTFGYVPRYAEYKFENSRVAGEFRTSLDYWHLGRIFSSAPALNESFVTCDPSHRIFAVTDPEVEKLYCQVVNKVMAVRPMPKYGTPTL